MSLTSIATPTHAQDDVLASSLARFLGFGAYPATAGGLVRRLTNQHAPSELTRALAHLPADRKFHDLADVCRALGLPVPEARRPTFTSVATSQPY